MQQFLLAVPHYGVDCLSEYWRRMPLNANALIENYHP
jgi:hypothetical protein